MREVIFLHVGECGNNMGAKYWELIASEHGLNEAGDYKGDSDVQLNKIDICFRETSGGRFIPRAVLIDLDPTSVNSVKNSKYGGLFHPDNYICSTSSTGNNFAKGFYSDGSDILESIMEVVRKELEFCDSIQTFQLFHSLGGGTGSGLGCLTFNKINEEHPDRIQSATSVLPVHKHSESVTEAYNALLSVDLLMTNSELVEIFDNDAVIALMKRTLQLNNPSLGDINHMITTVIASMSANLRFTGQLNSDFRKLTVNLIPFPRFIFLMNSFAPLVNRQAINHTNSNLHSVMKQVLDSHNVMIKCDPKKGKYIAASTIYRGHISIYDIENEVMNFQNKNTEFFVDWIPSNIKICLCDIPPRGMNMSVSFIGNSTAFEATLTNITANYASMYRRRAFIHWYFAEGLEEQTFHLAEDNVLDLIDDYQRVSSKDDNE